MITDDEIIKKANELSPKGLESFNACVKMAEWVRGRQSIHANISGSVLLQELIKIKDVENTDGMPVIKVIDKPNGGTISYIRYDAMIFKLNELLK